MVHARTVGVEYSRNFDLKAVLAMIVEVKGFGTALPLIIARPRTDRIDISPVVFGLRVHGRVAVDLASRGL